MGSRGNAVPKGFVDAVCSMFRDWLVDGLLTMDWISSIASLFFLLYLSLSAGEKALLVEAPRPVTSCGLSCLYDFVNGLDTTATLHSLPRSTHESNLKRTYSPLDSYSTAYSALLSSNWAMRTTGVLPIRCSSSKILTCDSYNRESGNADGAGLDRSRHERGKSDRERSAMGLKERGRS